MRNQIEKSWVQKKVQKDSKHSTRQVFLHSGQSWGVVTAFQKGLDSPGCRAETQCATNGRRATQKFKRRAGVSRGPGSGSGSVVCSQKSVCLFTLPNLK